MLVHCRCTYLELIRLLARRGVVGFTLEPKERVGLFAVSNLRFRPCPNVELLSSEGFSKLEVDLDTVPTAWFGITDIKDCFHNMLIPEWLPDFFSHMPVTAREVGVEGSTLMQKGCQVLLESVTETTASRAPALGGLSPLHHKSR